MTSKFLETQGISPVCPSFDRVQTLLDSGVDPTEDIYRYGLVDFAVWGYNRIKNDPSLNAYQRITFSRTLFLISTCWGPLKATIADIACATDEELLRIPSLSSEGIRIIDTLLQEYPKLHSRG